MGKLLDYCYYFIGVRKTVKNFILCGNFLDPIFLFLLAFLNFIKLGERKKKLQTENLITQLVSVGCCASSNVYYKFCSKGDCC